MRAITKTFSIAALGLVGTLALAAPASAAVAALPASDLLYAVDCETDTGQLLGIDATSAAFTAIGSGTPSDPKVNCAGPSAFDYTTNTAYWISWNGDPSASLMTVDLATGVSTFVGDFVETGSGNEVDAGAIAIDRAGNAFLIGEDEVDNTDFNQLYSLNLATAEVTFIAELLDGDSSYDWWSFAFNPGNSTFYGIAEGSGIWSVDVTDGSTTLIAAWADLQHEPYGITFDSEGAMWGFTGDNEAEAWGLFSTSVTAPIDDYVFIGESALSGAPYFSESIFTAPAPEAPALAATGAPADSAIVLGALAGGLLLAGAGAVALRRRVTRAA